MSPRPSIASATDPPDLQTASSTVVQACAFARWTAALAAALVMLALLPSVGLGPVLLGPTPELDLWLGLALAAATATLGSRRERPLLRRLAALACLAAAARQLLRLLGDGPLDEGLQVSALGAAVLLVSLLLLALALRGLANAARPAAPLVALTATAALGVATLAAASVLAVGYRAFGALPDHRVFIGWPVVAVLGLLTPGLAARLRRHRALQRAARERPELGVFGRQFALLLGTGTVAGLLAAGIAALAASDLIAESLQARAEHLALRIEREVRRSAGAAEQAAREAFEPTPAAARPGAPAATATPDPDQAWPRLAQRLQPLGQPGLRWRVGADLRTRGRFDDASVVPIRQDDGSRVVLTGDGTLQIEARASTVDRSAWTLQLRVPALAHLVAEHGRWALTPRLMDCARTGALLRCTDAVQPGRWVLSPAATPRVLAGHDPEDGPRLAAFAPLGDQGAVLVLQADSAQVFRALGGPLLLGFALWSAVAALAALWSYRRQLPALRALDLARAQLQAGFNHAGLPMLLVGADGRVEAANAAAEALADRQALVGRPVTALLPRWDALAAALAADPQQRHRMSTMLRSPADGTELPVEVQLARFDFGHRPHHVLTLRDLRAERAERAAQALLHRLARLFDEAHWGIVVGSAGPRPVVEMVNPAYARMVGHRPQDMIGQPIRRYIARSRLPQVMALRRQAEQAGHARAEMMHRQRDGREFPVLVDMSAVRDAAGRLEYFVVSLQDISDLKLAEQQLRHSEARLRSVLQALPVGVWIGNLNGEIELCNPAARRIWTDVAAVGAGDGADAWWQARLRGGDSVRAVDGLLQRAVQRAGPVAAEVLALTDRDGRQRTIASSAAPMLDDRGRPSGAVAVDEDITPLRQSRDALHQAQRLLERVLATSAIGMALCDADGCVTFANVAWSTLLGGPPRPGAPRRLDDLLEPSDPLRGTGLATRLCRAPGQLYVGEHRMVRGGDSTGWTLLIVSALQDGDGRPARLLAQVLDVDAQRRIADELAASQRRLSTAQRMAGIGDWRWDTTTELIELSPRSQQLLGLPPATAAQLPLPQLLAQQPAADRPHVAAAIAAARRDRVAVDVDLRWQRPDGALRYLHAQAAAEPGAGTVVYVGTVQDVTERKLIENELRQSKQRLRELVFHEEQRIEGERKRIAREVHDELGQLLTALRMDLSLLRQDTAPQDPARAHIDAMRATVDTMIRVVRQVVTHLRPAALDLGLLAAVEWLAEDFGQRWPFDCQVIAPEGDLLELDEPQALALFRVVQESLTNIARHAQARHVSIEFRHRGGTLRLMIRDDGQGFDPAAVRGGGLGLLGMRERMLAIGAELAISSGPGGTQVSIALPLHRPGGDVVVRP